jgi:Domain of unknown function (DUF4386)
MASKTRFSPRLHGRIIAVLFLLNILAGIFAQGFVSEQLVVFSDAAATATNITTHQGLFQVGLTVYLVEMAIQIALAALWYVLLKPVNRSVALTAAFLELSGCIIKTFARVLYIAPIFVLGHSSTLKGFSTEQLQSLALVLLRANDNGAAVALAFFGFSTVLSGYLVFRSTFLPRWLGALSMIAGLGWLTFLYQPLGYRAFPIAAIIGLLGVVATILRLLIVGVNEERWKARTEESLECGN